MSTSAQHSVTRIVSGGQTGVDQGALDAAIWLGIEHGGWCPKGRRSEAGRIPERFVLQESEARDYSVRTEQNVVDSDGTLILFRDELTGGTAFTARMAKRHGKPCFQVDLTEVHDHDSVRAWIIKSEIRTLNVAGPRASSQNGITEEARQFVVDLFR